MRQRNAAWTTLAEEQNILETWDMLNNDSKRKQFTYVFHKPAALPEEQTCLSGHPEKGMRRDIMGVETQRNKDIVHFNENSYRQYPTHSSYENSPYENFPPRDRTGDFRSKKSMTDRLDPTRRMHPRLTRDSNPEPSGPEMRSLRPQLRLSSPRTRTFQLTPELHLDLHLGDVQCVVYRSALVSSSRRAGRRTERLACLPPTNAIRVQSPVGSHSVFSHVGIVADDAVGQRVFSGISRFSHPLITALLHTHLNYPLRLSGPRCPSSACDSLSPTKVSQVRFSTSVLSQYSFESCFNRERASIICYALRKVLITHFESRSNHDMSLVQHFYIGTKIKLDPGSELGSFDFVSGKMLEQTYISNTQHADKILEHSYFRKNWSSLCSVPRERSRCGASLTQNSNANTPFSGCTSSCDPRYNGPHGLQIAVASPSSQTSMSLPDSKRGPQEFCSVGGSFAQVGTTDGARTSVSQVKSTLRAKNSTGMQVVCENLRYTEKLCKGCWLHAAFNCNKRQNGTGKIKIIISRNKRCNLKVSAMSVEFKASAWLAHEVCCRAQAFRVKWSGEIWAALNIKVSRTYEDEVRYGVVPESKGGGNGRSLRETADQRYSRGEQSRTNVVPLKCFDALNVQISRRWAESLRQSSYNAQLHHCDSKLDPRSDIRSTQKTVAPFEYRAGLEIEIKFFSNRRNWRFEISIREQQPSSTNFIDESEIQNHEMSLMQHWIKLDPGTELGSFDLVTGKLLMQPGIKARWKALTRQRAPLVKRPVRRWAHGGNHVYRLFTCVWRVRALGDARAVRTATEQAAQLPVMCDPLRNPAIPSPKAGSTIVRCVALRRAILAVSQLGDDLSVTDAAAPTTATQEFRATHSTPMRCDGICFILIGYRSSQRKASHYCGASFTHRASKDTRIDTSALAPNKTFVSRIYCHLPGLTDAPMRDLSLLQCAWSVARSQDCTTHTPLLGDQGQAHAVTSNIDNIAKSELVRFMKDTFNLDCASNTLTPTTLGRTCLDLAFARHIAAQALRSTSYFSHHHPIFNRLYTTTALPLRANNE
ncbi:hypothetical protein PR048_021439 [Dryococelus australis]|uniref:Uncharacterized protein n=1 Tax=Dryococelus australis TaxID=614101 RepID=A0ABQ9GYA2_9NEOP|nr:hypothetical protein PR048_021439 [Dryococelus australis]